MVDDYTVKMIMKAPRPFFLYSLADNPAGYIYSPQTIDRPADERGRNIAGTGPFMIKEWMGPQALLLEANPDYNWASSWFSHNGPPYIQFLHLIAAPDDDSRMISLETGETHFITGVGPIHVARLKEDPNFSVVGKQVPGMPQMNHINASISPTNDLRVRQAINYATNRDEIAAITYFGTVKPAYGPLSASNIEYNPEVEKLYPYDPEKAKELLNEAGWWDEDGDSIAESHGVEGVEDGTQLEVRITRNPTWQQYTDVWMAQLKAVGFKPVSIMAGAGPDWYGCINQLPSMGDVFIDSLQGMTRDWDKDQCVSTGLNFGCACDIPELQDPIQEYLAEATNARNMDERKAALGKMQLHIMEQAMEVPIYELWWYAGITSSLEGVKTNPTGFYYFFYDAKWER